MTMTLEEMCARLKSSAGTFSPGDINAAHSHVIMERLGPALTRAEADEIAEQIARLIDLEK